MKDGNYGFMTFVFVILSDTLFDFGTEVFGESYVLSKIQTVVNLSIRNPYHIFCQHLGLVLRPK
jgi:hypothetical protein